MGGRVRFDSVKRLMAGSAVMLRTRTWLFLLALTCLWVGAAVRAQSVRLELVTGGLSEPTYVTAAPGDSRRLFILEKQGRIRILDRMTGVLRSNAFLNIKVFAVSEAGLLGMAFAPDYAESGVFYVTASDGAGGGMTFSRYRVSAKDPEVADPQSREMLVAFPGGSDLHAAGWIGFHPKTGHLYLTVGDGDGLVPGAGFAHQGNSQKPDLLRGKLLRMELENSGPPKVPSDNPFVAGGGLPLVWASGVRNPWRASFDRETGDFWFGDVGGNHREEINVEPMGTSGGRNYGWSTFEGKLPTGWTLPILPPTNSPALIPPVFDYPHTLTNWGGSVVGGYVYRGKKVPQLVGRYVFGDYLTGFLWSLKRSPQGVEVTRMKVVTPEGITFGAVSSFGEDENGELYVLDLVRGSLFRFEPGPVLKASEAALQEVPGGDSTDLRKTGIVWWPWVLAALVGGTVGTIYGIRMGARRNRSR